MQCTATYDHVKNWGFLFNTLTNKIKTPYRDFCFKSYVYLYLFRTHLFIQIIYTHVGSVFVFEYISIYIRKCTDIILLPFSPLIFMFILEHT